MITKALNYSVTFFPYHCTFQDLQTGKMIDLDGKRGGLYVLVRDNVPKDLLSSISSPESSLLRHYRLGYPSLRKLQQVLPWMSMESFECESCQLGKYHCAIYRQSSYVSHAPFELIHSNIWGPSRVSLVSRYRYYIVFIDNFSKVS